MILFFEAGPSAPGVELLGAHCVSTDKLVYAVSRTHLCTTWEKCITVFCALFDTASVDCRIVPAVFIIILFLLALQGASVCIVSSRCT